ncbi:B-cell antigen receptor complex-associated protein beta chain isoform X1 [Limanda limanda]|uniref:B-cell antigen receptor complex-associated protein beta chain isoform X1 n=1 Tax=Limanda limanda TaxID=27771 RepID=UPI0029C6B51C|nr:B-cell antigen receptor complex-associated protein beta chain isoform X1 [Limanda limanda]
MRWLLAGCCVLALIGLSEALSAIQRPRFYGVNTGRNVGLYCISKPPQRTTMRWFKANKYDDDKDPVVEEGRISFHVRHEVENSYLHIRKVQVEDSGVYFCEMENGTWGPGTQLIVLKATNLSSAARITMLKDALIFLQGLLLAAAVTAILLRGRKVSEKTDIIYEEPETDHIYEGLEIERCDGGLYEELSVYAQADDAEAPWE